MLRLCAQKPMEKRTLGIESRDSARSCAITSARQAECPEGCPNSSTLAEAWHEPRPNPPIQAAVACQIRRATLRLRPGDVDLACERMQMASLQRSG